jgi:high-affinity iron transporter
VFDAFAVTLRELAELMLIVVSLAACLVHAHRPRLVPYIAWGLVLGLVPAAALAVMLMDAAVNGTVEAAVSTLTGLGVLLVAMRMASSEGRIRSRVQLVLETWLDRPGAAAVVVAFVALAAFRESLEVAVFMRSISARSGTFDALAGMAFGVAAAGLLLPIWKWLRIRSGLLMVFRASALLLSLLSIQMLLHGISELHRLQAAAGRELPWATAVEPFLEGGSQYAWLCAALMTIPLLQMVRGWWAGARQAG